MDCSLSLKFQCDLALRLALGEDFECFDELLFETFGSRQDSLTVRIHCQQFVEVLFVGFWLFFAESSQKYANHRGAFK